MDIKGEGLKMNYQDFNNRLVQPNSGSEAFNSGVKQANSRAKKLVKKVFDELHYLQIKTCSSCQYAKLDTKRYLASHICLLGINAIDFDFCCNKHKSDEDK